MRGIVVAKEYGVRFYEFMGFSGLRVQGTWCGV